MVSPGRAGCGGRHGAPHSGLGQRDPPKGAGGGTEPGLGWAGRAGAWWGSGVGAQGLQPGWVQAGVRAGRGEGRGWGGIGSGGIWRLGWDLAAGAEWAWAEGWRGAGVGAEGGAGQGGAGAAAASAELCSVLLQVMGMVRVPLYTQKDRMGGLPNFLGNSFVGTAKFQLLFALKILNMVPEEKLAEAVAATQKPKKPAIDQAAGVTGNAPAPKPVNELVVATKAGNELADRAENQAAAQAVAEAAEQPVAGLESGAVAEQLVAEAVEQPAGLGADAVVEQRVAEPME